MKYQVLIYLILVIVQVNTINTNHLCEAFEVDVCVKCAIHANLNTEQICECSDGYTTSTLVNNCQKCLFSCKTCNSLNLTECLSCDETRQLNTQTKRCECKNKFIHVDYQEKCIESDKMEVENFLFYLEQHSEEIDLEFEFCKPGKHSLNNQTDILSKEFTLKINNSSDEYSTMVAQIGTQASIAYSKLSSKASKANLYKNFIDNIRPEHAKRDYNESVFNIAYSQGLIQNSNSERFIGFDIRNPESQYHFNLIVNCGSSSELSEENINKLLDHFFNFFQQCPPYCQKCIFFVNDIKCLQCNPEFSPNNGECSYNNPLSKLKEISINSQNQLVCEQGYYMNGEYCNSCGHNCKDCDTEAKTKCKTCMPEYFRDDKMQCQSCVDSKDKQCNDQENCKLENCHICSSDQKKCLECNFSEKKSFYLNNGKCITIVESQYLLCQNQDKCYHCLDLQTPITNMRYQNSVCICNEGYFMNYRKMQCEKCDQLCRQCVFREKNCQRCNDDAFFQENQCLQCAKLHCEKCSSYDICVQCQQGYYIKDDGKVCEQCQLSNCVHCSKEDICELAGEGYFVEDGQVKKCGVDNCKLCKDSDSCTGCEEGYFIDEEEKCVKCVNDGCKKCSSDGNCSSCLDGYFLDQDETICKPCLKNCQKCYVESKCEQCQSGLILDSRKKDVCKCEQENQYYDTTSLKCEKCSDNCIKCQSLSQCTACKDGHYAKKGKCEKCFPDCDKCENDKKCLKCARSKILISDKGGEEKCSCSEGCKSCKLDDKKENCNESQKGYYLVNNTVKKCDSSCAECDKTKCLQCAIKYFQSPTDKTKCEQCGDNCDGCTDSAKCTKCSDKYYVDAKGQCIECSKDCFKCSLTTEGVVCSQCTGKMILEEEKCVQSNCSEDLIENSCKSCIAGFFANIEGKCQKCSSKCLKCEIDENTCTFCRSQNYLKDQTCIPCPSTCETCEYSNEGEVVCKTCKQDFTKQNSQCVKESNLFSVLIAISFCGLLYCLYTYRSTIIELFTSQGRHYQQNPVEVERDVELAQKDKKPLTNDKFNLFNDD